MPLPDIHYGTAESEIDWRKFHDNEPDDDEPLAETPRSVVRMLGFDPLSVAEDGEDAGEWPAWIGVDLDGTLAQTVEPFDPLVIGDPIPEVVEKVKEALANGKTVKVFTARLADQGVAESIRGAIRDWTQRIIGQPLDATNQKDQGCEAIWDLNEEMGVNPLKSTAADAGMPSPNADGTPEEADKLMEWRSFNKEDAHENHHIYERHEGKIRILVTFKDGKVDTATCNLAAGERGADRPESSETRQGFEGLSQFAQTYGD